MGKVISKFKGEIVYLSVARENTFRVEDNEGGEIYTCHCAFPAQWDKLYDFLGNQDVEVRPLKIMENGDLIVQILN